MKLENVEIKWVYHNKPNKFGKLNLTAMLDEVQAAELEAAGLTLKVDENGKRYDFTQTPVTKDNKQNPINVFDRFGNEFDGIVPNGTHADITFVAKKWNVSGNSGIKGYIRGVKLLGDIDGEALEFDKAEPTDDSPF